MEIGLGLREEVDWLRVDGQCVELGRTLWGRQRAARTGVRASVLVTGGGWSSGNFLVSREGSLSRRYPLFCRNSFYRYPTCYSGSRSSHKPSRLPSLLYN